MREFKPMSASEETRAFVESFVQRVPAFEDFCGLDVASDAPVFVWEEGETPDLGREGLHLVDGSIDQPEATLSDLEYQQWVLVAGDVRCKELTTMGWFFVAGHLEAEIVTGQSGCNNMLSAKSAKIGVLLELGHSIGITGELDFDVIYSEHGMVTSDDEGTDYPEQFPADVFVDELVDDETIDWTAWRQWVDEGRQWWRD